MGIFSGVFLLCCSCCYKHSRQQGAGGVTGDWWVAWSFWMCWIIQLHPGALFLCRYYCVTLNWDFSCSQGYLEWAFGPGCCSLRLGAVQDQAESSAQPPNAPRAHLPRPRAHCSSKGRAQHKRSLWKDPGASGAASREQQPCQHRCHGHKWQSLSSPCMEWTLGRVQRASLKIQCHEKAAGPGAPAGHQQPPCHCPQGSVQHWQRAAPFPAIQLNPPGTPTTLMSANFS